MSKGNSKNLLIIRKTYKFISGNKFNLISFESILSCRDLFHNTNFFPQKAHFNAFFLTFAFFNIFLSKRKVKKNFKNFKPIKKYFML